MTARRLIRGSVTRHCGPHHRTTSPCPDLLIAAIAKISELTVLHADKDYELIAELTGQPVERLTLA